MSRQRHFFDMGASHAAHGKCEVPHDPLTEFCSSVFGEGILAGDNANYRAGQASYVPDESESDGDDDDCDEEE